MNYLQETYPHNTKIFEPLNPKRDIVGTRGSTQSGLGALIGKSGLVCR